MKKSNKIKANLGLPKTEGEEGGLRVEERI